MNFSIQSENTSSEASSRVPSSFKHPSKFLKLNIFSALDKMASKLLPSLGSVDLNTKSDLKLKTKVDEDVVKVLFDQAVLSEGGQIKEPAEFVKRMNKLMLG